MADFPSVIVRRWFAWWAIRQRTVVVPRPMACQGALVCLCLLGMARNQGHRLIETIEQTLEADGQMDYAALAVRTGKPLTADPVMIARYPSGRWFSAVASTGRAVEALLEFHQAAGDPSALTLAKRIAEPHLRHVIDPTGSTSIRRRPKCVPRGRPTPNCASCCGTPRRFASGYRVGLRAIPCGFPSWNGMPPRVGTACSSSFPRTKSGPARRSLCGTTWPRHGPSRRCR